jgi:hypothetical protein
MYYDGADGSERIDKIIDTISFFENKCPQTIEAFQDDKYV